MGRDLDIQVHETNRSPKNFNPKQSSPRDVKQNKTTATTTKKTV